MTPFPDFTRIRFAPAFAPVARTDWEERVRAELKMAPTARPSPTLEPIALPPLFTAADVLTTTSTTGLPGIVPFLRGPHASMYCGRPWTIRQYAGFSTAAASNAFFRRNLAGGQKGLSVAFDLPTHRGYDSDHPAALGDVGKTGVAMNSVEDMAALFAGIPLHEVSVSLTMSGAVIPILAFYLVAAVDQGARLEQLAGTIQNDILKEYVVRNAFIYPPRPSLRILVDVLKFAAQHLPRFHPISVSGYHFHEAGAPADLELAYTLADALEYVRAGVAAGLDLDQFVPRFSFFWAVGKNFFMEVAKLRAARLLWAGLLQPFHPCDEATLALRAHAQTSGWSLTAQAPDNNLARTCLEALAAVSGQVQSLHTNAFDEALALPTDLSARLARSTQLFLQAETDLCHVIDPWGGSFLVESLTESLVGAARGHLQEIESGGGMLEAIAAGLPQARIEAAAARRQALIDSGRERIIGVNAYPATPAEEGHRLEVDSAAVHAEQLRRLRHLKQTRDAARVASSLAALTAAAASGEGNLLELAVAAARARATLGEITQAMECVFGRHTPPPPTISAHYLSDGDPCNDEVRQRIEAFAAAAGRGPRMLIAKLGQDGHDRGAKVVAAAFRDFGFEIELSPLFLSPAEAVRLAAEHRVDVLGLSSLGGAHTTFLPLLRAELAKAGAEDWVLVLGGIIPARDHAFVKAQGVEVVFGPGTPLPEAAAHVLEALERRRERRPSTQDPHL